MVNEPIRFGPSGNSESFYAQGHKHSIETPKWLHELGLNAFEYSFGRGVNLKEETGRAIGAEAAKYDISVSVHAPYYINFCSDNPESRLKSRSYLTSAVNGALSLGAKRVVFHSGAVSGKNRVQALATTIKEVEAVLFELEGLSCGDLILCPETMGKPNQQGTLDEIIAICSINPARLIPTLDFGHINALEQGSLRTKGDFERIFDAVEAGLGYAAADRVHIHFSHIEFGKAGEIKHLTFEDAAFGPFFEPLAEVLCERKLHPVVICESRDVMAEDALRMKQIYEMRCCGT